MRMQSYNGDGPAANAVHAAHHLTAACAEMLRPELGDLCSGILILEGLCPAEHRKRPFFHNLAIHVLTTFQCHFDPKRSKGTDCACAFSQCGRCVAMESGKGFGMVALSLSMSRTMTGMAVRPARSQAYLRLWPAMIS